ARKASVVVSVADGGIDNGAYSLRLSYFWQSFMSVVVAFVIILAVYFCILPSACNATHKLIYLSVAVESGWTTRRLFSIHQPATSYATLFTQSVGGAPLWHGVHWSARLKTTSCTTPFSHSFPHEEDIKHLASYHLRK
ncbi:unnamed protein product, partial [Ectocarpus sp. 12 AP-2014]